MALLFGAELDAELERGRQLQAGIPAERDLQLPPRDSSGVENRAKEEHDVERARTCGAPAVRAADQSPCSPDSGCRPYSGVNFGASSRTERLVRVPGSARRATLQFSAGAALRTGERCAR